MKARAKPTTALLIIDMINLWTAKDSRPLFRQTQGIVLAVEQLAARARSHAVPIIYANDNFGEWHGGIDVLVARARSLNPVNANMVERLSPQARDYAVLKPAHSAFFQSPLDHLLKQLGVKRLILTGISGDQCVLATAADALLRDYTVVVPRNTVVCPTPARTRAILRHFDVAMDIATPDAHRVRFGQESQA